MNEQENKLIAEFMGYKHSIEPRDKPFWLFEPVSSMQSCFDTDVFRDADNNYFLHPKYHTSWDWLMPVVEKIKTDTYENFALEAIKVSPAYTLHTCDIQAVYTAVISFINWYNQQALTKTV